MTPRNAKNDAARREVVAAFDRERFSTALRKAKGVVLSAAKALEITPAHFWRRSAQIGLDLDAIRDEIGCPKQNAPKKSPKKAPRKSK